jgi:hypothetical protein
MHKGNRTRSLYGGQRRTKEFKLEDFFTFGCSQLPECTQNFSFPCSETVILDSNFYFGFKSAFRFVILIENYFLGYCLY